MGFWQNKKKSITTTGNKRKRNEMINTNRFSSFSLFKRTHFWTFDGTKVWNGVVCQTQWQFKIKLLFFINGIVKHIWRSFLLSLHSIFIYLLTVAAAHLRRSWRVWIICHDDHFFFCSLLNRDKDWRTDWLTAGQIAQEADTHTHRKVIKIS